MNNNARIHADQFPGRNGGERIQAAIDSLEQKPKVIEVGAHGPETDGRWLLRKAVAIPSNTTPVFHGSRLFLADKVSDNMIRNYHAETGDGKRHDNIHILGLDGAELAKRRIRFAGHRFIRIWGLHFTKWIKPLSRGSLWGPQKDEA